MRIKALIALTMAVAVYPAVLVEPSAVPPPQLFALGPVLVAETLVGITIGTIASMPLVGLQMGGYLMGYQMGLSLAQSFNPEFETSADVLGQVMFYMGTALFIVIGGVDALFYALAATFDHVPPGGYTPGAGPLAMVIGAMTASIELALRVSAPLVAIAFIVQLAMGFIMKTMPQINVMTIGFAIKIVLSLALLVWCVGIVADVSAEELGATCRGILRWASSPEAGG